MSGGFEVTCLGSGLRPDLVVLFGGLAATATEFRGDNCLVCHVPPGIGPGPVAITFEFQHQLSGGQYAFVPPQTHFTYQDDSMQQFDRFLNEGFPGNTTFDNTLNFAPW